MSLLLRRQPYSTSNMWRTLHQLMKIKYLNYIWRTLRSRYRTGVNFDKICVFCDKCCVCIDKCVFIIVKIKCVNSGRICDICDKINFTTNYIPFTTSDIHFIKTYIIFIIFDTFDRMVPCET